MWDLIVSVPDHCLYFCFLLFNISKMLLLFILIYVEETQQN